MLKRVGRPAAAGQADADRDLPARWPALVARAEAQAEPLRSALLRALDTLRAKWCKRWNRPWPL